MRNTKQKELILTIINDSYDHPTAEMIHERCLKSLPKISLGTIYRNLNLLVDQNLIKKIKVLDNIDRYDHLNSKHVHFICLRCHEIIDVMDESNIKLNIGKNKVLDYDLVYKGICEKCQRKED